MSSQFKLSKKSTCSRPTETLSTLLHQKFTPLSHQTPLQSTVTVKIKSLQNSSPVSSTSWDQTRSHPSESWLRATNHCRRLKGVRARRTMRMMMISQIWLQERTLRTKSNRRIPALGGDITLGKGRRNESKLMNDRRVYMMASASNKARNLVIGKLACTKSYSAFLFIRSNCHGYGCYGSFLSLGA